ncbi:hypothetical protein BC833DRAFT_365604 [Globomyces pollinis-pini]|nr:hypothetical protein BC833DRAFT_365604 [Globomyces pollinis-pini]
MIFVPSSTHPPSTDPSVLILASPGSVAFLPQLSIDLLINSLAFNCVGSLLSPFITPLVGSLVYDHIPDHLHTAAELYQSDKCPGVSLLQFRSNIIKGSSVAFSDDFTKWFNQSNFSSMCILASLDATRRNDRQLATSKLRYRFTNNISETLKKSIKEIGLLELEDYPIDTFNPYSTDQQPVGVKASSTQSISIPPGAGPAKFILNNLLDKQVVLLSYFTQPGDNSTQAFELADCVNDLYHIASPQKWSVPSSWDVLYGPETELKELF